VGNGGLCWDRNRGFRAGCAIFWVGSATSPILLCIFPRYRCEQKGLDPDTTFFELAQRYIKAYPKGPFNLEARRAAGFNENELALLEYHDQKQKKAARDAKGVRNARR